MNYCLDYTASPEIHPGGICTEGRAAVLAEQHDNAECVVGKHQSPQIVPLRGVSHLLCVNVHKLFSQLKYNPFEYLRCQFAMRKIYNCK